MFRFFKSEPSPDHLATAKQKLNDLVSQHLRTLALRRRRGVVQDAFGTIDAAGWMREAQKFVDKVWAPQLSSEEKAAVFAAGLNSVAQDFIEDPVREECARLHSSGECDMTVPVIHTPGRQQHYPSFLAGQPTSTATRTEAQAGSGLIIDEPWISLILNGRKTWEMRSTAVARRGKIALIAKGTKSIVGLATLVDSLGPLDDHEISRNGSKHHVPPDQIGKWRYAWVLQDVVRLPYPVPYAHPAGAVKWVNLDAATMNTIQSALP